MIRRLSVLLWMPCLWAAPASAADFKIFVDPNDIVATQSEWFHGINSEADVQDRYVTSPGSEQALRAAGFEAARFPGGIPSDFYDWSCPYWVDHQIGQPGECPSQIDEVYEDQNGNILGGVWDLYGSGSVIDNAEPNDDQLISGPELAYLDCLKNPPSSPLCSHYNAGRASTSDFWAWMTGYDGNPYVSAPSGVAPADFVHVAGPPQRPMNGFGAHRILVQTNVFGLRPDDFDPPHLTESRLDALRFAETPHEAWSLVPPKTPNRGPQHAGQWAASIDRAGIDAFYEVGNEPDGYIKRDALLQGYCSDDYACLTDRDAYLQSSIWLDMYADQFAEHAQSIRSSDPDAKVFGPAAVSSGANLGGLGWYVLEQFALQNASLPRSQQADGISFHYYPDGSSTTQEELLDGPLTPWVFRRSLASMHVPWVLEEIEDRLAPYGRPMPLVVSEWHLSDPNVRDHNRSYGLALASLDVVASFARRGIEAHQFHSLHTTGPFHSPDTLSCPAGSCTPWRPEHGYHGYGLLSGILDQFGGNLSISPQPPDTPTATYYTLSLWQHMGAHALGTAEAPRFPLSSSDPTPPGQDEVAVHVHRDSDENLQILVINKTDEFHSIRFDLEDYVIDGDFQPMWSVDPVDVYDDASILKGLGSLYYNGSVDPGYTPNLPAPGYLLVPEPDAGEVELWLPGYSVRLVQIQGDIVAAGGGIPLDPPDCDFDPHQPCGIQ